MAIYSSQAHQLGTPESSSSSSSSSSAIVVSTDQQQQNQQEHQCQERERQQQQRPEPMGRIRFEAVPESRREPQVVGESDAQHQQGQKDKLLRGTHKQDDDDEEEEGDGKAEQKGQADRSGNNQPGGVSTVTNRPSSPTKTDSNRHIDTDGAQLLNATTIGLHSHGSSGVGHENNNDDGDDNDDDDDDGDEPSSSNQTNLNSEQSSSCREDLISLSSSSLSSESMPELRQRKNLQKLYNIVNEICTSEEKFLATLKLLNEDFRNHIMASVAAQQSSQSGNNPASEQQSASASKNNNSININNQDDLAVLQQAPPFDCIGLVMKHLPQLQALNERLYDELRQARNQWPSTQKISHVLVKIGPFLKHYSSYIRDFECIQQQFQDNSKKSPLFRDTIRRFEQEHSDKCGQLSIQHHLLKPIQRIPQYRLLLQQYLHHLKPDDADYEDTVSALEVVSRVAEHANQSLSEGANFAKLLSLQAKIVGGKQRDIIQPGRVFIKEGELLKVCRKQIQPRWFVLLSDALFYLKQIQSNDILYLKYELPLDDCQVELPSPSTTSTANSGNKTADKGAQEQTRQHEQHVVLSAVAENKETKQQHQEEESRERELNVCTTVRSMTLIAKSRQERDEWFLALSSAIESHVAKRRSFRQDGASGGQHQDQEEPFSGLIGRKAPIWTPDSRVSRCQLCTSNFSALFRRHHCRACGRVVCSACSSNKAPLIYLKCRAARVCDQCFESLRANMHLYYLPSCQIDERELRRLDEHFKTLLKSQFIKRRMFSSSSKPQPKVVLLKGASAKTTNKTNSDAQKSDSKD